MYVDEAPDVVKCMKEARFGTNRINNPQLKNAINKVRAKKGFNDTDAAFDFEIHTNFDSEGIFISGFHNL